MAAAVSVDRHLMQLCRGTSPVIYRPEGGGTMGRDTGKATLYTKIMNKVGKEGGKRGSDGNMSKEREGR